MKKQSAKIKGTQFDVVEYSDGEVQVVLHLPNTKAGDILTKPMQDWLEKVVDAATQPMPIAEATVS